MMGKIHAWKSIHSTGPNCDTSGIRKQGNAVRIELEKLQLVDVYV